VPDHFYHFVDDFAISDFLQSPWISFTVLLLIFITFRIDNRLGWHHL